MTAAPLPVFVQYHCPCHPLVQAEHELRPAGEPTPDETEAPTATSEDGPADNEAEAAIDGLSADVVPVNPNSDALVYQTHALCSLYFCEDCLQIRCGQCVLEEITGYYCPNCLFEVPSASVKAEKNQCARNCFECPCCFHSLTVVEDPTAPTESARAQPFYLNCAFCRWSSREIGVAFEKQTGLAAQLQKRDEAQAPLKEFDHLREHFEAVLRANQPSATNNNGYGSSATGMLGSPHTSSFLSSLRPAYGTRAGSVYSPARGSVLSSPASVHSPGSYLNSPDTAATASSVTPSAAYQALHRAPEPEAAVSDLMARTDLRDLATREQRDRQGPTATTSYALSKHWPRRIALRSKRAKRCRDCRHILIKPEPKAQATRFKIKFIAMNFVPNVTIVRNPVVYYPNRPTRFVLRFVNPQYHATQVTLAVPDDYAGRAARVTVMAPAFQVGAYNDIWEYEAHPDEDESDEEGDVDDNNDYGTNDMALDGEEDDGSDVTSPPLDYGDGPHLIPSSSGADGPVANTPGYITAAAASAAALRKRRQRRRQLTQGIYERKANETAVVLEATPLGPISNLIFPLHVTFDYVLEGLSDDDEEEEGDKVGKGGTPGTTTTGATEGEVGKPTTTTQACSFWLYINLGQVVDSPAS
ncbi:hypothetical protein IWQ60_001560 [Tieghemiomyces parasiticus]|uniref:Dynactin subunit 4 n=1 Tax=Tieghemiomyces parasiticus TaxID=78921 RepID=A0A9W8AJ35_9FUNG|nr:hypothetical protein IWQ60_001560 [Tieghemiomyces parasiticus]